MISLFCARAGRCELHVCIAGQAVSLKGVEQTPVTAGKTPLVNPKTQQEQLSTVPLTTLSSSEHAWQVGQGSFFCRRPLVNR
jgi:hypothetical protein